MVDTIRITLVSSAVNGFGSSARNSSELNGAVSGINQYYNNGWGEYPKPNAQYPTSIDLVPCVVQSPVLTVPLTTSDVDLVSGTVLTDLPTPYVLTVQIEFNPYVCMSVNPIFRGTAQQVRWAASKFAVPITAGLSYVRLFLLRESDPAFRLPLTTSGGAIPNSGSYVWSVPSDLKDAVPAIPNNTNCCGGRNTLTDVFIAVISSLPPNALASQQLAVNVTARSQRFTIQGPIPDGTRGVEETVSIEALTVGSFTLPGGGSDGSNFYVKLSFGSSDYRITPIAYSGIRQPFSPPVLYHIHLTASTGMGGAGNNGVADPRLSAWAWNTADTSSTDSPTFLGSNYRTDIRTGFVGVGGRQISLPLSV